MIAWMLRSVLATCAVAGAATLADALVRRAGLPRRPVWALSVGLAGLLPVLAALLPATSSQAALSLPPSALNGLLAQGAGAAPAGRTLPEAWLLGAGWLVLSAALVGALAYAAWRLRRLCAVWPTVRLDGGEVVLSTGAGPLVVGLRRPRVVVPAWVMSAPEAERRMVLAHEREHVLAGDARLLAAGALVPALAPWNLPAWWLVRRLREAVETDCDRRVLAGGFAPAAYGRLLLSTAAGSRLGLVPAVALAEPKRLLERRLLAMTEKTSDRRVRRLLPLAVGAAALVVFACEVARPDANAPASPVAPRGYAAGDTIRFPGGGWAIARSHGCAEDVTRAVDRRDSVALARALAGSVKCKVDEALAQEETGLRTVDARGASDVGPLTYKVTAVDGEKAFTIRRRALAGVAERFKVAGPPGAETAVGERPRRREARSAGTMTEVVEPYVELDGRPASAGVLKTLSPERIRSINVLKGPAAAAHTGRNDGRAVIQITTK